MSANIYLWEPSLAEFNTLNMASATAYKKATKNEST